METRKNIGILWSGGLDSTLLVYRALKAGHYVTPIYVKVENNRTKIVRELAAIEAMMTIFNDQYLAQLNNTMRTVSVDIQSNQNRLALAQVPLWILGLIFNTDNIDEFHMGYVMGDCAISYLDEIRDVYQSYQPFTDKPLPKLMFPLSKTTKDMIWNELPNKIAQLTTFCERPYDSADDCGDCTPCKRYIYDEVFSKYTRNRKDKLALGDSDKFMLKDDSDMDQSDDIIEPAGSIKASDNGSGA